MKAGDFFGEIAALTGSRRTADVITTEPIDAACRVAAQALRGLMGNAGNQPTGPLQDD